MNYQSLLFRTFFIWLTCCGAGATGIFFPSILHAQTAPAQPPEGPGGSRYSFSAVEITKFGDNDLYETFWLYEPTPKPPAGTALPVVVFWHGTSSQTDPDMVPNGQELFLQHIARKGYLVVFPLYQYGGNTLGFAPQIQAGLATLNRAFRTLLDTAQTDKQGIPLIDPLTDDQGKIRFANVGISRGGGMSINTASYFSADAGIPVWEVANPPEGICAFVPGAGSDHQLISTDTRVLIISAEEDALNGPQASDGNRHQQAWEGMAHIPCANKNYILAVSDRRGVPPLVADHSFSGSGNRWDNPDRLNSLDYFGAWKWSVGLFNCIFRHEDCAFAFGREEEVTFMGTWSDGQPVNPSVVLAPDCIVSSAENHEADFSITLFPNPVRNGRINIEGLPSGFQGKAVLSDAQGNYLVTRPIEGPVSEWSLPDLPSGNYWITLEDGQKRLVVKKLIMLR